MFIISVVFFLKAERLTIWCSRITDVKVAQQYLWH